MRVLINASSERGLRDVQQDRYAYIQVNDVVILGVADGNGGHGGSELAESVLKSAFSHTCWYLSQNRNIYNKDELEKLGLNSIKSATEEAARLKESRNDWTEAGTTITFVILTSRFIGVFWVGDSPAYLFNKGRLAQLTKPHTLFEMLLKEGTPRKSLEQQPSLNSVLVRCVGHTECKPDFVMLPYEREAVVLVGSDGVFGFLSEQDICDILQNSNLHDISKQLIQKALGNGSNDNLSVVVSLVDSGLKQTKTIRKTRLCEWKN